MTAPRNVSWCFIFVYFFFFSPALILFPAMLKGTMLVGPLFGSFSFSFSSPKEAVTMEFVRRNRYYHLGLALILPIFSCRSLDFLWIICLDACLRVLGVSKYSVSKYTARSDNISAKEHTFHHVFAKPRIIFGMECSAFNPTRHPNIG